MRRLLLLGLLLVCFAVPAAAQTTSVSAVIKDSQGNIYANCSFSVNFVDPGTSGKLPLLNGSTFQTVFSGTCDSSGNFSVILADNSVIASSSGATGTQWKFSFCAKGTPVGMTSTPCFTYTATISGTSKDLTSTLIPLAPILNPLTSFGSMFIVGTTSGTVTPPTLAPGFTVLTTGGTITAGTYYCVHTLGNLNGETTASPQVAITVTGSTNRITFNPAGNEWLEGAYKYRAYCGNTTGGPYFLQTPWTRKITPIGTITVTSNVATLDTGTTRHGLVDGDKIDITGATDSTFNGTGLIITSVSEPSTGNSTITYNFTHANGSTTGGTVNFFTGVETNWDMVFTGGSGQDGLTLDAIVLSGTQQPTSNTATVDPYQVAVNQTRTVSGATISAIKGTVRAPASTVTLTTPLICAYTRIEGTGQDYAEQSSTGIPILQSGAWANAKHLGTVMVMGPYCTIKNFGAIKATSSATTNGIFIGYGASFNMNGLRLEGGSIEQLNTVANSGVHAVRGDHIGIAFGWVWQGMNAFVGTSSIASMYFSRSTVSPWEFRSGRINCEGGGGPNTLSTAVKTRGGAYNKSLGTAQAGVKPVVYLILRNSVTESCKGPAFDFSGGGTELREQSQTADPLTAASADAASYRYGEDFWTTGANANLGIFIDDTSNIGTGLSSVPPFKYVGPLNSGGPSINIRKDNAIDGNIDAGNSTIAVVALSRYPTNTRLTCDTVSTAITSAPKILNYPTTGSMSQAFTCLGTGDPFARVALNRLTGLTMFGSSDSSTQSRWMGLFRSNTFEFWGADPGVFSNLGLAWDVFSGSNWRFAKNTITSALLRADVLFQIDATSGANQINVGGPAIIANSTMTLANNYPIAGANAAGTAVVNIIRLNASDQIQIGASGNATVPTVSGQALGTTALPWAGTFTGPTVNTGVSQGSGLKHQRVASCATAATAGATCDTTLTWTSAFADANYTVVCSIAGITNQPRLISIPTVAATNVTVRIEAATAAAASGTIECIAMHD